MDLLEQKLPSPRPPFKDFARDKRGHFIRDERNNPIPLYDEQELDYVQESRRISDLQSIAMAKAALAADPNIEWVTLEEDYPSHKEYLVALRDELQAAGIATGHLSRILRAMNEMAGMESEDLRQAQQLFPRTR